MKKIILPICLLLLVGCSKGEPKVVQDTPSTNQLSPNIYQKIDYEYSWAYDISDPNEILENVDVVLKVKVLAVEQTAKFVTKDWMPATGITVETVDVLSGDLTNSVDKIYQWGGMVTIKEVIANTTETRSEKAGWTSLSDERQSSEYIYYEHEGFYDMKVGNEYIVALKKGDNGCYYLVADGYNIFVEDTKASGSGVTAKNVITNKLMVIEN